MVMALRGTYPFPINDEAGKVLMPLERHFKIGSINQNHSLFFSASPAPVPLYFDGVTLKR